MAAKTKKKRNKAYKGSDAAIARPAVTRIDAVNRNPVSQWWHDHKRVAKPVAIAAAVILVIIIVIIEIIRIATGA